MFLVEILVEIQAVNSSGRSPGYAVLLALVFFFFFLSFLDGGKEKPTEAQPKNATCPAVLGEGPAGWWLAGRSLKVFFPLIKAVLGWQSLPGLVSGDRGGVGARSFYPQVPTELVEPRSPQPARFVSSSLVHPGEDSPLFYFFIFIFLHGFVHGKAK